MRKSAYRPELSDHDLKQMTSLLKKWWLDERQQQKIQVLLDTHHGKSRTAIAKDIWINVDTVTQWKKFYTQHWLQSFLWTKIVETNALSLNTWTQSTKKNVSSKKVISSIKDTTEANWKLHTWEHIKSPAWINKIEQDILHLLKSSYQRIFDFIHDKTVNPEVVNVKKKVMKLYKKELAFSKDLIAERSKKIKKFEKQRKKDHKNELKNTKKSKKKDNKDKEKKNK